MTYIIILINILLLTSFITKTVIKNYIFISRPYNIFFLKDKIHKNNIYKKKIYIPK